MGDFADRIAAAEQIYFLGQLLYADLTPGIGNRLAANLHTISCVLAELFASPHRKLQGMKVCLLQAFGPVRNEGGMGRPRPDSRGSSFLFVYFLLN